MPIFRFRTSAAVLSLVILAGVTNTISWFFCTGFMAGLIVSHVISQMVIKSKWETLVQVLDWAKIEGVAMQESEGLSRSESGASK
jgi:hypothetical protein